MKALRDAFDEFETQRKRLEVHTSDEAVAEQIARQVTTRNLDVVHKQTELPAHDGYIVIRTAEEEFLGTVGVSQFQTLFTPETKQLRAVRDDQLGQLLDLLDQTVFRLPERRSLLAVSREIEDRAWRCNQGALYAGFQRARAFESQELRYERLHNERDLSVRVFVKDHWNVPEESDVDLFSADNDEIGRFWFVIYDGGDDPMQASGLIAEEREPDIYYGFWSYNPVLIDTVLEYLDYTYSSGR